MSCIKKVLRWIELRYYWYFLNPIRNTYYKYIHNWNKACPIPYVVTNSRHGYVDICDLIPGAMFAHFIKFYEIEFNPTATCPYCGGYHFLTAKEKEIARRSNDFMAMLHEECIPKAIAENHPCLNGPKEDDKFEWYGSGIIYFYLDEEAEKNNEAESYISTEHIRERIAYQDGMEKAYNWIITQYPIYYTGDYMDIHKSTQDWIEAETKFDKELKETMHFIVEHHGKMWT